jgi:hypothetical protein
MNTLYLIGFLIGVFFIVRGILDMCRELDRADMSENDE